MEDRKKTEFSFYRCFLEYSKPILSLSSITAQVCFFEILSKLKLDWMFAAEGEFYPAQWFSSCCQA